MLQLKKITGNKKIHLDLLLLADPEEKAIDKYINDSEIFSLIENEKVLGQCAVTKIDKYRCEIKNLTVLGAVIAFILGACIPIAILGFTVLERGEIAAYQIERVKGLWYVLTSWSCASGIVVCVIYFLLILLIKKIIKKKGK